MSLQCMRKIICNICLYQSETDTLFRIISEDTIALDGKNGFQHFYIPTRNWYIYWGNIRRYHCIMWEKIICIIWLYLSETDTFIGIRIFPTVCHRKFPYVHGNPHYCNGIFINYCTLINIFSTQLWFYQTDVHINTHTHTKTHTHITDGSIFISELLPLKLEVWWSQLEMFKWVTKTHLRKERSSQKQP